MIFIKKKIMVKLVRLMAKAYSYLIHEGGEGEKAKGTKSVQEK